MRNKTSLLLMEQLVMAAVFALAAALCLQAFVLADGLSRKNEQRSRAALLAQNGAEMVKARGGVPEAAGDRLENGAWVRYYDENGEPAENGAERAYRMEIREAAAPVEGLGQAEICVFAVGGDGEPLFRLTVAWQEDVTP